ncbi:MAG: GNAT family N-acetyltransferase [Rhodobacteraceae bacterium]|nr:GNAT family N-acetyltransferase [Paracoccaceae bacterium]
MRDMNWQAPTAAELMHVVNATWPAAREFSCGPFVLRDGKNGGKRASAATLEQPDFTEADIESAATEMQSLNQPPLFIIRDSDSRLDDTLAKTGYRSFDFVTLFAAPSAILASHDSDKMHCIAAPIPLAAMEEIWAEGDIGPARIEVMQRVKTPKTYLLGRLDDAPSGAGFVAIHNGIAMIHALEVLPKARRNGLGLQMMAGAAKWALNHGAETFALAVVSSNLAACGLYQQLGMIKTGNYHYRIKDKT